ncbi:MAG TPA: chemotaxis protein CheW [Candidatus Saccharimonadales bacterium]|nr:chemotaxis protein CheW [Candidatus Saccharimonadales bacterium]
MNDTTRFVTFPLGDERFALDSGQVKELIMPSSVYSFPHTMSSLEGVLVRRGTVIPVCNPQSVFGYEGERSFYVVAQCNYAGRTETVAIPVTGDCELVQGERTELPEGEIPDDVTFVAGLLHTGGKTVPLLDLDKVVAHCIQPATAVARETKR